MIKANLSHTFLFLFISLIITFPSFAQNEFDIIHEIKTTPVKSQDKTGTCWSYATISFLETEAIRKGKPELDLSEMYIVRYAYVQKAIDYVRFHGKNNFSQGGQAHDVVNVIKEYGVVPEQNYPGMKYEKPYHDHSELVNFLKGALKGIINSDLKSYTPRWIDAVSAILDVYLGIPPKKIEYKEKKYTPQEFMKDIAAINPDDYIELTSFSHHPYYQAFDLEVPDNWSHDLYYNLPLDELIEVMKSAIKNNYSICWDGDVGESFFSYGEGKAWWHQPMPVNEKNRQALFNSQITTDDHLMHLTGLAKNLDGEIHFITKNSWGKGNSAGGYVYMSEDYVKMKTIAIMVHKDAIPNSIAKKLGIK